MISPGHSSVSLPPPGDEAKALSAELARLIRGEVARANGSLGFARYMELALYAPGLGYYSAGSTKFGPAGDFITAPEISTALGTAFATTLAGELSNSHSSQVLELGAGTGALAAQLLDAFAALGRDVQYLILEPSAELRVRQQLSLARFGVRVTWLNELPTAFCGAIVANEVLDALPVARFVKSAGETCALGVVASEHGFAWDDPRPDAALADAVESLEQRLGRVLPDGYCSELCLSLPAWTHALAAALERGSILLADYGLARAEYYHEQRSAGTLICHYRHRAHSDPFFYPGLQDITAWVDFSACADAAAAAGLEVAGFTTQGQYLASVLAGLPAELALDLRSPQTLSALKTLLLPGEMGERFKVLLLRKGVEGPPFPGRDFRARL